ncbi:hypothetical protein GOODEAATRI_031585 [Goodea atripinnis]|uniref:CCHC-type domain-containing protein n=1 Tax=Goodea atripinnis TaxID=208336 RepID=A0ABV0MY78_9TELE
MLKIWEEHTDSSPLTGPLQKLFKQAMIRGQTGSMKEEMLKLVGGNNMPLDQWIEVMHHLERADEEENRKRSKIQTLQQQLLTVQLRQAKEQENEKKKENKAAKSQLLAASAPVTSSEPPVVLPPQEAQYQIHQYAPQAYLLNRGRTRSRGYRNKNFRGPRNRHSNNELSCWKCGQPGHKEKFCFYSTPQDSGPPLIQDVSVHCCIHLSLYPD